MIYFFLNISPNVVRSETKKKFMTTKYNEVNVRNGPGLNHLKIYKIYKKGYPLKIIKRFENWKKVSDYQGISGWISDSQLSDQQYVIMIKEQGYIFKFPDMESKKIALVKKSYVLKCEKCESNWCLVKEQKTKGWVKKQDLWGF